MAERVVLEPSPLPYVVLSCAVSLDGYLDDASQRRLMFSGPADLDRVDDVRADSDAILVGAATVRNDDPRLLVRSAERIAARRGAGRPWSPMKVTVTERLDLDRDSAFFSVGDVPKLVYCPSDRFARARALFGGLATVVDGGEPILMRRIAADLYARGVRRLMVEGGGTLHTQFLTEGIADELQLVVAPIFVGDSRARRWADDGVYRWCGTRRARLLGTRTLDDVVLLRYALSERAVD